MQIDGNSKKGLEGNILNNLRKTEIKMKNAFHGLIIKLDMAKERSVRLKIGQWKAPKL